MGKKSSRRIHWMAPIENASAKFALVRETAGVNNDGMQYFGGRIYNQTTTKGLKSVTGFYLRKFGRVSELTNEEKALREAFSDGVKWANAASNDLTAKIWNQQQYEIVKNDIRKSCGGVHYVNENNLLGYLRRFAIVQRNDGKELPTDYRLPAAS